MDNSFRLKLQLFVPVKELKAFIESQSPDSPSGGNKSQMIQEIDRIIASNQESIPVLENLLSRYKSAGRCSVSWGVIEAEMPAERLEEILIEKYGEDVIKSELRPEITNRPALNRVQWLDDKKTHLRLEFVEAGKSKIEYRDYVLQQYRPTKFVDCFLRIHNNRIITEVRAELSVAEKYHSRVAYIIDSNVRSMEFNRTEIIEIEEILKTKRKSANHKKLTGDFDTVTVKARPDLEDLKLSKEYKEKHGEDDVNSATCHFEYNSDSVARMSVSINIARRGSIWFRSEVPEEVIDHVFSVVRSVKEF